MAADVPPVDAATQAKAADEMISGKSPNLNILVNACLITRDQSRALAEFK